ncbi:MAG: hypothetical protein ACHQT8_01595 [Chlamydiales bacterium]
MNNLAVQLHETVEAYNVLQEPTAQLATYLSSPEHRGVYKIVLLVNHLFRAAAMTALTMALPLPSLAAHTVCFLGSLCYRLTAEARCAYKFALPAFAGSVALPLGYAAGVDLISGAACASLAAFSAALLSVTLVAAYVAYIVLTVSYDVDHR